MRNSLRHGSGAFRRQSSRKTTRRTRLKRTLAIKAIILCLMQIAKGASSEVIQTTWDTFKETGQREISLLLHSA